MRVTNAMISNNMMLGLNKNMNRLNTLYDQMISQKKIQRPSDDPIILGRSLKLRLNVLETEQYQTNVSEARSWMEISENSMNNAHSIYDAIRYEYQQAANGHLGVDDRQKILETVKQLKNQLVQEANANYAGRNVFSGYKTDKKVLFEKDQVMDDPVKFEQKFTKDDLEVVSYRGEEYYRIRVPYGDIIDDGFSATYQGDHLVPNGGHVVESTDEFPGAPPGSYYHPANRENSYFLKDTGELIIDKATYDEMMRDGGEITINYQKDKFKAGDPNPEVFFDVNRDTNGEPILDANGNPTYTGLKDSQKIEYEIGIGTKMDINVLGKNIFDPLSLRDIDEMIRILDSYEDIEKGIADGIINGAEKIDLSELFSSGIGKMDKALSTVSTQIADLGSRMNRLDLTKERLGDDRDSYRELLSRTEDVELEQAYIDFNTQYVVYQAALQVTAKVVQPTLMDFLR